MELALLKGLLRDLSRIKGEEKKINMKIIRSTKCSLKFVTANKISKLAFVLSEYGKVVNAFIGYFWNNNTKISKIKLLFCVYRHLSTLFFICTLMNTLLSKNRHFY